MKSDIDKEKTLNAMELMSGYIANELNSGKSKEEIVNLLTTKMSINKELAIKLVYKNEDFQNNMYYFSKNYIRKNLLKYISFSCSLYIVIFFIISYITTNELYPRISKYFMIIFFISIILFMFTAKESKNIIYNRIGIIFSTLTSLSSFLLGSFLMTNISWSNIDLLDSWGSIQFRFLVLIFNSIIELGPNIIGGFFLLISLLFIGISWNFYYKITIAKIK